MPVKIVDASGNTSIAQGTIKKSDIEKMISDYVENVSIAGIANGLQVNRRHGFYFPVSQLRELLNSNPDASVIEISLAVQLPGSSVVCMAGTVNIDVSNNLAVILNMAKIENQTAIRPFREIQDMVLINGYQAGVGGGGGELDGSCCPGTNP